MDGLEKIDPGCNGPIFVSLYIYFLDRETRWYLSVCHQYYRFFTERYLFYRCHYSDHTSIYMYSVDVCIYIGLQSDTTLPNQSLQKT